MFPRDSRTEIEVGYLRSGRKFRVGKRRKNATGRGSCNTTRGGDYELTSHLDEGSCDGEEEYYVIFEEEEESKELVETQIPDHEYGTPAIPHTSPEVVFRNMFPSRLVNLNSTNTVNSGQGSLTTQKHSPSVLGSNIMPRIDIKLPIFNGNGLKDPEQHWFLCEVVWTV